MRHCWPPEFLGLLYFLAPETGEDNCLSHLFWGWTGMRGVVSLASALTIPLLLENGSAFPYRNLILFITFIVILLTLLVQGLTLPYIIKRLNPFGDFANGDSEEQRQLMKKKLKAHIYQFLKKKQDNGLQDHTGMQRLMQSWEEKFKNMDESGMDETTKGILLEMLESERKFLVDYDRTTEIDDEIIQHQMYLIDLEEERLKF